MNDPKSLDEIEITSEDIEDIDVEKEIYVASNKLRGLGELFCMARSEPPMSDGGFIGISEFLNELSDQLENLLEPLRTIVKKASKCDEHLTEGR